MHYPVWDIAIGYGVLMAAIAVVHVFISHFAIGGGLYLVLAEHWARRRNHGEWLAYLERLSRFFALVTLVAGALTGVGIWFVIGLLNPSATEVMIHHFVWGWAAEWCFFVIEIAAAILYYYGWRTLSARNHLILGWIYFVAAWVSLFLINGILTFMLTPGRWLETGNFWHGFFNSTMWPSLVLRTGVCVMLAGLYAMAVASRYPAGPFKAAVVRFNAVWGLAGLAVAMACLPWYWNAIPEAIRANAPRLATAMDALSRTWGIAAALAVLLVVFGLALPRRQHLVVAIVVLALGLAWFDAFEWFRESIRKPYIIHGYMYGNRLTVGEQETFAGDGLLARMAFRTGDDGADLFRTACRSCHTLDGFKAVAPAFDGTDPAFIAGTIRGLHTMKGSMPPFAGTDAEAETLAAYLWTRVDPRPLAEVYNLEGVALGRKVYEVRCGRCHEFGGYNDKSAALLGLGEEEYQLLLEMSGDISDNMPAFTGDEAEAAALIEYLMSLEEGGDDEPA